MKFDKLTKVCFAVIAINLTYNTVKDIRLGSTSYATESDYELPSSQYGLVPVNADGSITVKFSDYDRMDVNIVDISTSDLVNVNLKDINTSDELNVNIEEVGGWSVYGKIPVEVKD
ncbi:MAG: hypothetical protein AB8B72_12555 [Crocinitomicaceae bacterium]